MAEEVKIARREWMIEENVNGLIRLHGKLPDGTWTHVLDSDHTPENLRKAVEICCNYRGIEFDNPSDQTEYLFEILRRNVEMDPML